MACNSWGSNKDLLKAKDDQGNMVEVCETCFELTCEGYKVIE